MSESSDQCTVTLQLSESVRKVMALIARSTIDASGSCNATVTFGLPPAGQGWLPDHLRHQIDDDDDDDDDGKRGEDNEERAFAWEGSKTALARDVEKRALVAWHVTRVVQRRGIHASDRSRRSRRASARISGISKAWRFSIPAKQRMRVGIGGNLSGRPRQSLSDARDGIVLIANRPNPPGK